MLASYTAVLVADTAVPAWHEARHELPVLFVGSAAAAGGGVGLLAAAVADNRPAARLAAVGPPSNWPPAASWSSGWLGFPVASIRLTGPGKPGAGTVRRTR